MKAIDKLADAFVKAAPETRQAMSWTEKVCASLAIVASHGAECRVPYDGSDALYVRGLAVACFELKWLVLTEHLCASFSTISVQGEVLDALHAFMTFGVIKAPAPKDDEVIQVPSAVFSGRVKFWIVGWHCLGVRDARRNGFREILAKPVVDVPSRRGTVAQVRGWVRANPVKCLGRLFRHDSRKGALIHVVPKHVVGVFFRLPPSCRLTSESATFADWPNSATTRGLHLSDEERAAMADAGWTEGGGGFWRL